MAKIWEEQDITAEDVLSNSTSTTVSAVTSPGAVEMAANEDNRRHPQEHTTVTKKLLDPYTTVSQLSYAPTTQTTVVTTTTTTTTSFPPLLLRPPRHLSERDPRLYPLAAAPTPSALRKLNFTINGRPAIFSEAEDADRTLEETSERFAALESSNGSMTTTTTTQPQYLASSCTSTSSPSQNPSAKAMLPPSPMPLQRQDLSPPSITEAAELASLQRRNKRRRPPIEEITPATPDTDAGISGQHSLLRTRASRSSRVSREALTGNVGLDRSSFSSRRPQRSLSSQARPSTSATDTRASSAGLPLVPSNEPIIATSATPPIAESDLEPIIPVISQEVITPASRHLSPLDTISAQDASLPSPSLSPITAAAQLAGDLDFESTYNDDIEDDVLAIPTPDLLHSGYRTRNILHPRRQVSAVVKDLDAPSLDDAQSNLQLPTPTFMDISTMIHSFDAMPTELQTYIMYQLLRRSAKSTLRFVADVVNPALKRDFLADLPLELSLNIVKFLDSKSMCQAAQVSKRWRHFIDSDEQAWFSLLNEDGFELPEGEVERAVREGWGWQFSNGLEGFERDLSSSAPKLDGERSGPGSSHADHDIINVEGPVSSKKRKATSTRSVHKRQRRKGPSSKVHSVPVRMRTLDAFQGPIAHANAAAIAVPNPEIGLPSLSNLHLYKSLYHRHHSIRKSWMDEDSKPHHLAFKAHGNHVVTCLQFDTEKIITGSDDNKINVYDTKTGMKRKTLDGHEGGVWALQYDGNILVSGSTDRSVRVWDIETGKCLQLFQGHTSTVRCLVILKPTKIGEHPDGTPIMMPEEPLIITGSRDSTLRVWKLPQVGDRPLKENGSPTNDYENPYFVRVLNGHHHSVRAIAAHGDTLVSGSYDHTVRVWKISNGELVYRLQGHTQKVYSVVLDHKRNRCISGSMDYLVKVWSLDTGTLLYNLDGHTSLVGLLDLSNERLVSAAADATLRIWDPENGKCDNTLKAHTGAITCFQHDGQKVISGSDGMLKMWDIKTGECVKDLLTGLSGVWQVRFNDRRCVAAVHRNNWTYIEVLDFGAARDGVPEGLRGRRIAVDEFGREYDDIDALEETLV